MSDTDYYEEFKSIREVELKPEEEDSIDKEKLYKFINYAIEERVQSMRDEILEELEIAIKFNCCFHMKVDIEDFNFPNSVAAFVLNNLLGSLENVKKRDYDQVRIEYNTIKNIHKKE